MTILHLISIFALAFVMTTCRSHSPWDDKNELELLLAHAETQVQDATNRTSCVGGPASPNLSIYQTWRADYNIRVVSGQTKIMLMKMQLEMTITPTQTIVSTTCSKGDIFEFVQVEAKSRVDEKQKIYDVLEAKREVRGTSGLTCTAFIEVSHAQYEFQGRCLKLAHGDHEPFTFVAD